MKILLIDPPYGYREIGGTKQNFRYVLNKIPSLGLAYLAATVEREGHDVRVVDCTFNQEKMLTDIAKEFCPQIIGITATTPTFKNAAYMAGLLQQILPEAVYICGGSHASVCPEDILNVGVFDFAIIGEGERTFLELIAHIKDKQDIQPDYIHGLAFKRDGDIIITPARERIENLDSLPLPARHLLPPLKRYHSTPASYRKLPIAVIMSSRGCPNQCTFCDRTVFGEKFRKRSAANVMLEVEEVISKYGAKEIRFFDDTFTIDPYHVENICRQMKKIPMHTPWTCLTAVTAVNSDMLKMMYDAGCWQVLFGLESGEDYILERLGKNNTVEQNKKAVFWAYEAGLRIRADFLVGSPWETKETFMKTIEFAKSLPLDFAHFNKFVPYPGTSIYKDLKNKGYRFNFDNGAYINNQCDFIYVPEAFTKTEFSQCLDRAYKEFYLRPNYLMRRLFSIRTFTEFTGNLKGFYSILSL